MTHVVNILLWHWVVFSILLDCYIKHYQRNIGSGIYSRSLIVCFEKLLTKYFLQLSLNCSMVNSFQLQEARVFVGCYSFCGQSNQHSSSAKNMLGVK